MCICLDVCVMCVVCLRPTSYGLAKQVGCMGIAIPTTMVPRDPPLLICDNTSLRSCVSIVLLQPKAANIDSVAIYIIYISYANIYSYTLSL